MSNDHFGYNWQGDKAFDTPATATLYAFLDKEANNRRRVTGLSIEPDGVFIYTDSSKWCDDAGAGTFRGDSETAAIRRFNEMVQAAPEPDQETDMKDFTLHNAPEGTRFQCNTDVARDWVVERFHMLADPIVDDAGVDTWVAMINSECLTVQPGTDYTPPVDPWGETVVPRGRAFECIDWAPTLIPSPIRDLETGLLYGKLMPIDKALVARSPGIQDWSKQGLPAVVPRGRAR
jgi:hypothetical protein